MRAKSNTIMTKYPYALCAMKLHRPGNQELGIIYRYTKDIIITEDQSSVNLSR